MKSFSVEKFSCDLHSLRGNEPQIIFARKLGINRSTLSLLENGRQRPTLDILSRVCSLSGKSVDEYFPEL